MAQFIPKIFQRKFKLQPSMREQSLLANMFTSARRNYHYDMSKRRRVHTRNDSEDPNITNLYNFDGLGDGRPADSYLPTIPE